MTAALLTLALAAQASAALGGGDLAAIITYETHAQGRDGVTRETRYQERFVRSAGHVWTMRVLPGGATSALGQGHEVDLVRLARHLVPAASGEARAELVSGADRLVIDLERADYERVDVGRGWQEAWSLLPATFLSGLHASGAAAPAGARWLEGRTADETVRVLWSDARAFPLAVERIRRDGSQCVSIHVELVAMPPLRPWAAIANYRHRLLADFSD